MSISAIIHTFNAGKHIEKCLESVKSVDEIIVCDMHSTDNTIEIAKKYGCKILYHENFGFAEVARTYSVSQASSEWVLVVDADEVIPEKLLAYLKNKIQSPNCPEVFNIPEKNVVWGKFLHFDYPNYHCRFFKKSSFIRWEPQIHGCPVFKSKIYNIPSKHEDLAIIHYSFESLEIYISKMNKYTSLEVEKLKTKHVKHPILYAFLRGTGEFIKRYFLKKGYLDGVSGLIFAILLSFYKFLAILKLWEYKLNNQ